MPFDDAGFWFAPEAVDPAELSESHPPTYAYRHPIPQYTSQTPSQLLEAHYQRQTAPNPLLELQLVTSLVYPECATAIGSSGLIRRWSRPDGLKVVSVPVDIPGGEPAHGFSKIEVEFRNERPNRPSKGISLDALYADTSPFMVDPTEPILDKLKLLGRCKNIMLTIAWPGYKPEEHPILTKTCGLPLTRWGLGSQIAQAYAAFFRDVETKRRLPNKLDFFNIALHQGNNFKRDSLGIQLAQLHLVRFRNTQGKLWVAEVEIV